MAVVLRMPGVSADASEAALVEWAVSPGDSVKRGEVVATVETEKAVVDLEAEDDGVLLKTFASAGESVAIGGPIAIFVAPGEEVGDEAAVLASLGLGPQSSGPLPGADEDRSQDSLVPGAAPEIEHTADTVVGGHGSGARSRIFVSPLVRRLAAEAEVPLEELTGTGPNGRIRRRDLDLALSRRAATSPATGSGVADTPPAEALAAPTVAVHQPQSPQPRRDEAGGFVDVPHSKFRRAVAAALTSSKQTVPHFYLKATCRVDKLLELRQRANAGGRVKITVNDFFVKAAALAMVEVPDMNVVWTPEAVRRFDSVDIAVAMATERGLMTPVVRSVQTRSLSDISLDIKDLASRASAGTLKQPELEGGSLTISNLGMFGTEEFAAIINPPQVGILAVGAAVLQPVEGPDGALEPGRCVKVVLSVDHRPVDGALAARWLQCFKHVIEDPFRLLV